MTRVLCLVVMVLKLSSLFCLRVMNNLTVRDQRLAFIYIFVHIVIIDYKHIDYCTSKHKSM